MRRLLHSCLHVNCIQSNLSPDNDHQYAIQMSGYILREVLGSIRNHKTIKKNHPKTKNRKKIGSISITACKTNKFWHLNYQIPTWSPADKWRIERFHSYLRSVYSYLRSVCSYLRSVLLRSKRKWYPHTKNGKPHRNQIWKPKIKCQKKKWKIPKPQ